ncbi:MAG TPA: hypothetical protein VF394_03430 [Candidatus Acidoferrum sp.]
MGVADDVGPRTVSNAVADPSIVAKDGICEVDGEQRILGSVLKKEVENPEEDRIPNPEITKQPQ